MRWVGYIILCLLVIAGLCCAILCAIAHHVRRRAIAVGLIPPKLDRRSRFIDFGWEVASYNDGSEVHLIPMADTRPHAEAEDCACLPSRRAFGRLAGGTGFLFQHHTTSAEARR